eukprot:TRINITY_DN9223_c0_g2_i2.p1 TRINITY_DN9223_c0_g2~~TRINITY_DN9223_c0_g2_i2.p1  ORF type:complete len:103 (-),score=0.49 TRINITY_DN9223_c0_g2_i2:75-383(-)
MVFDLRHAFSRHIPCNLLPSITAILGIYSQSILKGLFLLPTPRGAVARLVHCHLASFETASIIRRGLARIGSKNTYPTTLKSKTNLVQNHEQICTQRIEIWP